MEEVMRKVGRKLSIAMGITLSFCLSLVGNLMSGHFSVPGFLVSFAVSCVISLIIGLLIPMKKLQDGVSAKMNLRPGLLQKCVEALISDLLYTPLITVIMILLARRNAISHGAQLPPFIVMFLPSFAVCMIVAFILIFFLTPFFLNIFLPKDRGDKPAE